MRTLRAYDSVSAVGSIYSFTSDSSVLSGILSGLLPGVNGTDALLSPVWSGWLVLIYSRSFVSCSSVPFSNTFVIFLRETAWFGMGLGAMVHPVDF